MTAVPSLLRDTDVEISKALKHSCADEIPGSLEVSRAIEALGDFQRGKRRDLRSIDKGRNSGYMAGGSKERVGPYLPS